MATKTEQLRAALLKKGWAPVDHISQRECLKGKTSDGRDCWIWLDKVGGGRFNREPKKTTAIALSSKSIQLLLEGKPSKFFGG